MTIPIRLLAAASLWAAWPTAARADCASGIDALSRQVEGVRDEQARALLAYDLRRARKEAAEDDEDECQEALDHARGLLRGRT